LLDVLWDFCRIFKLQVNLSKTAVVVLNGGKPAASDSRTQLLYGPVGLQQRIAVKDWYRYLGIRIHRLPSQGLRHGMRVVHAAGQVAAWITIRRCRDLHIDEPALFCTLFDQLVAPVLSYGAEIWGPWHIADVLTSPDGALGKNPAEQTQTRFLRSMMWISPKASSWLVLAELSRPPMYLHYLLQATRFWNKLCRLDYTHLASLAFGENAAQAQQGHDTWVARMVQWFQAYGVLDAHALHDPHTPITRKCVDPELVRERFVYRLNNMWSQLLSNGAQSGHRQHYASAFMVREHLDIEHNFVLDRAIPLRYRRATVHFRLFGQRLNKNVGKWYDWPEARRACPLCTSGPVEGERHVLFTCTAYAAFRPLYAQVRPGTTNMRNLFSTQHAPDTARFIHIAMATRARKLAELDRAEAEQQAQVKRAAVRAAAAAKKRREDGKRAAAFAAAAQQRQQRRVALQRARERSIATTSQRAPALMLPFLYRMR
jgi:hypothetical protein